MKPLSLVPHAVVFVASIGVMIEELVVGRLVASYLGNSLYTWTSVTSILLGGISRGNWLGGGLAGMSSPPAENLMAPVFLRSVR
jgi:predicted membrane-bound spermidine synthase